MAPVMTRSTCSHDITGWAKRAAPGCHTSGGPPRERPGSTPMTPPSPGTSAPSRRPSAPARERTSSRRSVSGSAICSDLVGRPDDALARYRTVADERPEPRAWAGIAAVHRKRGESDAAIRAAEEGRRRLSGESVDLRRLWLEEGWALSAIGRFEEAISAFEAGLAADPAEDAIRGRILVQLARARTYGEEDADAAVALATAAASIFDRLGDVHGGATAARVEGDALRTLGRLDEAAARLELGLELAVRSGSAEELAACLTNLGLVESDRGRFDEALADLSRAATEFDRAGNRTGEAFVRSARGDILLDAGRTEDARAESAAALDLARAVGNDSVAADALDTMSRIAILDSDWQEAAEIADEAADLYAAHGQGSMAKAARARGDEARARLADRVSRR